MKKLLFYFVFTELISVAYGQQKEKKTSFISNEVVCGLEAMAKIERLPFLFPPGTKKNRSISYDASGGNGFGLFQSTFKKYIDNKGELVIFDAYGPGCLYRQQMNIWIDNGIGKKSESIRIKYYFDHDTVPRVDIPVKEFFNGRHAPFTDPFTLLDKHGFFGMVYYPFCFKDHLKVTLSDTLIIRYINNNIEETCNWYQYDYLTYPMGTKIESWAPGKQDGYEKIVRKQWTHLGDDPKDTTTNKYVEQHLILQPNEKAVIFESKQQASITSIKLNITPYNAEIFNNTYIRIYWDDLPQPAVDMPVSYFFGAGGVKDNKWEVSLTNLLYGFNAQQHSTYCYWPMPFRKYAKIEIYNRSKEKIISLQARIGYKPSAAYPYPEGSTGYFMAKLTKDSTLGAWSRKFKIPYVNAFKEEGAGHVVAMNMWSANYLEDGDEFTYIDNSRTPQIHGSGTEDDFNQGWAGFTYQKPLWGSLINGIKGTYRIHMNEPYIFYNSINIRFEHKEERYPDRDMFARRRAGTNDSIVETEFLVWYYKSASGKILDLSDSLDVGNIKSEKAHAYKIQGEQWSGSLTQSYDSYETSDDYYETTDNGRSFNKYCEFKVQLDPNNEGVRIRQRINRTGNGLQTGAVYIDGIKLEVPWHIVTYSDMPAKGKRSFDGWFDCEYEIPSKYTKGKEHITLRIEYLQAVKEELNSFYYWIYSYGDKNGGTLNNSTN